MSAEEKKNNIKTAKKYDNVYFFFGGGGCRAIFPLVKMRQRAQHIHGRARLLKKESENLTHTFYYFNFLLLLFISHFAPKSTSLVFSRFLLPFVQLSHTPGAFVRSS